MAAKKGHLVPEQAVLIDQYMGSTPVCLTHTKGKEMLKDRYTGGTLFADYASGFVYV
jgi:hypothetical protein